MNWRQHLYSNFIPISSRPLYTLLLPCPHVSESFFSVMSRSSWVDSWLGNLFCFYNRNNSTWFLQEIYGQPECVYYLWVYFSDLICSLTKKQTATFFSGKNTVLKVEWAWIICVHKCECGCIPMTSLIGFLLPVTSQLEQIVAAIPCK